MTVLSIYEYYFFQKKKDSIFKHRFCNLDFFVLLRVTILDPGHNSKRTGDYANCATIAQCWTIEGDLWTSVIEIEEGPGWSKLACSSRRFGERWPRLRHRRSYPTGIEWKRGVVARSMIHRSSVTGGAPVSISKLATRLIIPSGVQWTVL